MKSRWQQCGLIALGAILGIMISLNFSAVAQRDNPGPLPVEELRAFTEVFGRVKSDYVEPVEDKKLINEAINGMLSGLDPHSSYLDAEAFKELQVGTQGEFGGLGIEVGMEDGFVKGAISYNASNTVGTFAPACPLTNGTVSLKLKRT